MSALILRVNKSGQPMNWIDWQDAVLLYAREQVIWWLGEDPLRIYGGFNRVSNQRSYIDVHPIETLPTDDAGLSQWAYDQYEAMDHHLIRFKETGSMGDENFAKPISTGHWFRPESKRQCFDE